VYVCKLANQYCKFYVTSWKLNSLSSLTASLSAGRGNRGSGRSPASLGSSSLLLQHRPIEGVVILVIEGPKEDPEQLAKVHVVRSLLEPKTAAVVEVHGKLGGVALAENFNWGRHLLLTNLLVLLLLGGSLETLPR